jgi:hypothetical protein
MKETKFDINDMVSQIIMNGFSGFIVDSNLKITSFTKKDIFKGELTGEIMKYTLTAYYRDRPANEGDLQVAYVIRDLFSIDVVGLMADSSCLFSVTKQEENS